MTSTERDWRVGHRGRDQMYYEEHVAGAWQRIDVDGEMLTGRAHHVIYFTSVTDWQRYPSWAQDRRDEIIARIKQEFREPDYEYDDGGPRAASAAARTASASESSPSAAHGPSGPAARGSQQGMGALLVASVLLFTLGASLAWMTLSSVIEGETILPMQRATLRRSVLRADEPATYWLAVGAYAVVGAGALTLGVFGLRERRRLGAR